MLAATSLFNRTLCKLPYRKHPNTLIGVWQWINIFVITRLSLRPEGGARMATDGHDGSSEHWQVLYREALLEFSDDKLPQRIRDAEKEIVDEMERSGAFGVRRQHLLDALCALRDLEKINRLRSRETDGKRLA
jgi:hypothetical protein